MSPTATRRIAALALGLAVAGLVVWLALAHRNAAKRAELEAERQRIHSALAAHAHADGGGNEELFGRLERELGLSEADRTLHHRMADEFLAHLRAGGCETLDAREVLRPGPGGGGPWFWSKDFHLNLAGHAAIGKQLAARIGTWGGRFAGPQPR